MSTYINKNKLYKKLNYYLSVKTHFLEEQTKSK